ncbi:BNR repeat-containing protein [Fulvivirgaceae bacterium BMA12]|uniref:BNR repeat-containing protein n=1 Tax=Agaribacillus aureus TaxID=3051825 RepID=A0ABT8KZ20_9BACT|nr:BNR repeat-containing protein [Fulvivirgaceae bacterium BMA12]
MNKISFGCLIGSVVLLYGCSQSGQESIIIDETNKTESIEQIIKIDSVWAGHPVGFCLLTQKQHQYIAYYNAERNMVVGQRNLDEDDFSLYILPPTSRKTNGGTSTVLGWDSHNYVTLGIDKDGFIHLSGNVHAHPITYFRSTRPGDISTLVQIMKMVGKEEKKTTYPKFFKSRERELIYTYRDGGSGNGNQIYNIYNTVEKTWSRMLDTPLTDGMGLMNAYISSPILRSDNWYHTYWVWRDTPDCSTNHDLSYMKSPDLIHWFNAFGKPVTLPATIDKNLVVVDPIPVKGGIINLAAKLCLDNNGNPVFAYHKYDSTGNLQLYTARISEDRWIYKQVTNWDYRWEFSGRGSINSEVLLKRFDIREDGHYELNYWHIKYGNGTVLLNKNFESIGKVLKTEPLTAQLIPEGNFPGMLVQTSNDIGKTEEERVRYILKWETLNRNRDKPRDKPWPQPSQLYLYKLKSK